MTMRRITIEEWRSGRTVAQEWARRVRAGFPYPYTRERPRDADEALLLRERGTPERLIGPEKPSG